MLALVALVYSVLGSSQGLLTIGTGTTTNTNTTWPAPYGNWYSGARHQMIITAAELVAAGASASGGAITSLAFNVAVSTEFL